MRLEYSIAYSPQKIIKTPTILLTHHVIQFGYFAAVQLVLLLGQINVDLVLSSAVNGLNTRKENFTSKPTTYINSLSWTRTWSSGGSAIWSTPADNCKAARLPMTSWSLKEQQVCASCFACSLDKEDWAEGSLAPRSGSSLRTLGVMFNMLQDHQRHYS